MPKKRTIQQKSEAKTKGEFKSLLSEWVVNELTNDFGFDFEVRITEEKDSKNQEVSDISFYVQSKSSINSKKYKATEDLNVDDWVLYLGQRIPVLIVKYDINEKIFYWEIAQNYLWDVIEKSDPNWRKQKTKRITLTKKIINLEEIKKAIIESQKRITRHLSLNLAIGEGININEEDLSELSKVKDKSLGEYKALSLKESYFERKKGNSKKSFKLLMDVYHSPKNDETKIKSIIGLIYGLNITNLKENMQVVALANEAIKLSDELKISYLKDFVNILKNQAILFVITKKMGDILMGLKIQDLQKEQLFSFFYNQELIKLNKFHQNHVNNINNSLKNLLYSKDIYYYLATLPLLLETVTFQIMQFAVFDQKIINEEKEGRKAFIKQCEFILDRISNIDLKKIIFRSLANYYYWTKENEKAIEYMIEAIKLGKEDKDKPFVETNSILLKQIKIKPNPYELSKHKNIDEMTTLEYKEMSKKILQAQGIDLQNKDDTTSLIKIALEDINPEKYFKYCEKLHISYLNTSPLGRSIGLSSMGSKFIWCKHCKESLSGFNLGGLFDSFQQNCKNCKFHKPRSKGWVCKVKWVKEQEDNSEFKKILNNFKKN